MEIADKKPRGRPRNEETREKIVDAAVRLARVDGIGGLTMEGIAAEAGVGKQTLYRWWPSRGDVLLEGLRRMAEAEVAIPRASSLRRGLEQFLLATFAAGRRPGTTRILAGLMADAQRDLEFRARFREAFLEIRRAALRQVFEHARERGELRAAFDVELGLDLAFGTLWYRVLVSHAPLDDRTAKQLADAIARAAT